MNPRYSFGELKPYGIDARFTVTAPTRKQLGEGIIKALGLENAPDMRSHRLQPTEEGISHGSNGTTYCNHAIQVGGETFDVTVLMTPQKQAEAQAEVQWRKRGASGELQGQFPSLVGMMFAGTPVKILDR